MWRRSVTLLGGSWLRALTSSPTQTREILISRGGIRSRKCNHANTTSEEIFFKGGICITQLFQTTMRREVFVLFFEGQFASEAHQRLKTRPSRLHARPGLVDH